MVYKDANFFCPLTIPGVFAKGMLLPALLSALAFSKQPKKTSPTPTPPPRMRPVRARVGAPLIDFLVGHNYSFLYSRRVPCTCPDTLGFLCKECRGVSTKIETIDINIELRSGSVDPKRFIIENVTDSSEDLMPGNLEITIESLGHPYFERRENDLHVDFRPTDEDYRDGYKFIVLPTGERIRLDLKRGQGLLVVQGRGVPFEGTDRVGNLIVRFVR
jgi:DnaJ-class molecular chaperone